MLAPNVLYVGLCLLYVVSSSWLYVAVCSFMLSLSWPQDNLKSHYVSESEFKLLLKNIVYIKRLLKKYQVKEVDPEELIRGPRI